MFYRQPNLSELNPNIVLGLVWQREKPYAIQMALVLHQVFCRKRSAMWRVNNCGIECNHRLPRLFVSLQVFNPNDNAINARKTVHRRITAEKYAVFQHCDIVGCVARCFDNLKWQREWLELLWINSDKSIEVLLFDWRVFVFAFAEEFQNLTEQPRQTVGTTANKRILTLL